MQISGQQWPFNRQAGEFPVWRGSVEPSHLTAVAQSVKSEGGQLLALWGSDERGQDAGFAIHLALRAQAGVVWVSASLDAEAPSYPDLSEIFPAANRMQRATYDLLGISAEGAIDQRKWLRHGAWPEGSFPLRKDFDAAPQAELDAYPFIRVAGEGVHEIPVGPIHAGTIEPGHFRFSVIGDRVLKLEERLGYTHKGVEKRFEGMDLVRGAKLAGRISGDSHSAYCLAYCQAVEAALAIQVPARAIWLRALYVEIERVVNHLGDLGYLGNDVALSFAFMQFWRLKEQWLRLCKQMFGHRYLFDLIIPGGVACDLGAVQPLLQELDSLKTELHQLREIYDEHATLQDRMAQTGIVNAEMAAHMGLSGLAGRASAQAFDLRVDFPVAPYVVLKPRKIVREQGDVLARAEVRFGELSESLRLIRDLATGLPDGDLCSQLPPVCEACQGLGLVEGWRGEVLVAVSLDAQGKLERVHAHDPSWQNWQLLEIGILGNIVPDFPLINKSFNLSYSGVDL